MEKNGGHVESSGLLERVHQSLNGAGLSYIDFSGVVPNPRLSLVKEGIRIGRSEGVDFLLPIGGGSVIDTAKGIGYGIANDFEIEDLLYGRVKQIKICQSVLSLQLQLPVLRCLPPWFSPLKTV